MGVKKVYVSTVQVVVRANNYNDACDIVTETFLKNNKIKSWEYVRFGKQYMYPTANYMNDIET